MIIRRCCVCKEEMGIAEPTTPEIIEYTDGYCRFHYLDSLSKARLANIEEKIELKALRSFRKISARWLHFKTAEGAHA